MMLGPLVHHRQILDFVDEGHDRGLAYLCRVTSGHEDFGEVAAQRAAVCDSRPRRHLLTPSPILLIRSSLSRTEHRIEIIDFDEGPALPVSTKSVSDLHPAENLDFPLQINRSVIRCLGGPDKSAARIKRGESNRSG